jgi:hypothetical protein
LNFPIFDADNHHYEAEKASPALCRSGSKVKCILNGASSGSFNWPDQGYPNHVPEKVVELPLER